MDEDIGISVRLRRLLGRDPRPPRPAAAVRVMDPEFDEQGIKREVRHASRGDCLLPEQQPFRPKV